MKSILVVFIILTVPFLSIAQSLKGKVTSQEKTPLEGVTIAWLGNKKGTLTNKEGEFSIDLPKRTPHTLLVSHVGYKTDTLQVSDILFIEVSLKESSSLSDVVVEGRKSASSIASFPVKTEIISSLELKKAACCDLAGCFETQASVQPQTTNILTNSKELRILGLSGIYNQVLVDGFPMIQGLTYTYGISGIPGPLVENIWIAKGANSVLQGYESIAGQINVITKEPDKADKLFLNGYINSFSEKHLNAIYSFKKNKWSNLTAFHMVQPANRTDKDDDTFLDLPLLTRYMISNRWKKGDESKWGWSTQIGVRYLFENRIGGQSNFNYSTDKGSTNAYGQSVRIQQPEAWMKVAYRMNDQHRFAFYASGFHQGQNSYFGVTNYKAAQTNGYANLQYEFGYTNGSVVKTGISYRHLDLNETISFSDNTLSRTYAGNYDKIENIPGVFVENTWNLSSSDPDKVVLITGVRADHHNQFGWIVTPRTLLKYMAAPNTILRGSIGTGWRTANIFSENLGLLVSSRDIIFEEALKPEKAINWGFNATHKFKASNLEGYVSLDFYQTRFQNQIFPDYDVDPTKAIIKNFTGKSASKGFQAEVSGTFHNRFSAKLGYVFLDVYQVRNGIKELLPFNSRNRLNAAASFMPLSKKWHIDANIHWYGKQRLPDTEKNPAIYQMPGESESYTIVNTQFTYNLKKVELYAGAENIFDFRQNRPIISWQEPFGQYFDTQFAWGPTRGRELYLGVRFTIK
jgi:outer membrane receptor for ferrienterochelin and colicins